MYSENAKKLIEIVNEKVDKLVFETGIVYGLFYDMDGAGVDYDRIINLDAAERVFYVYPNLARYMQKRRNDFYFSDREVKSLAYVLFQNSDYAEIVEERQELERAVSVLYEYELI